MCFCIVVGVRARLSAVRIPSGAREEEDNDPRNRSDIRPESVVRRLDPSAAHEEFVAAIKAGLGELGSGGGGSLPGSPLLGTGPHRVPILGPLGVGGPTGSCRVPPLR